MFYIETMVINSAVYAWSCLLLFLCFTNSIASSLCNYNVKMTQNLLDIGFHRNLTYGIVFGSDKATEGWLYNNCLVSLDQTLPAGVFANPDELVDLRRTVKVNAIPKNRINIELPAEQSSPSGVYVIGRIFENKAYLWLPVHARYHMAVSGGGQAHNVIGPPKLYLRCPDERLTMCDKTSSPVVTFLCNGSSKEKCSWIEVPYTMMTTTVTWDVPVGNVDHYYMVSIVSTFVIVFGSLYLLKTIHEHKVSVKVKKQN